MAGRPKLMRLSPALLWRQSEFWCSCQCWFKHTERIKSTFHFQTLQLAKSSQASTNLLATIKPRLIHQITRQRSIIGHSRKHDAILWPLEHKSNYLTITPQLGDIRIEWSCSANGNPFCEAFYTLFLSTDLFCDFMWPTTSVAELLFFPIASRSL